MAPRTYNSIVTVDGVSLYDVNGDPNGVLTATRGSLAMQSDSANVWQNTDGGTTWTSLAGGGGGDVSGPASSTDNALVLFDGLTGKLIKESPGWLDDGAGNLLPDADNSRSIGSDAYRVEQVTAKNVVALNGSVTFGLYDGSGFVHGVGTDFGATGINNVVASPYVGGSALTTGSMASALGGTALFQNNGSGSIVAGHARAYVGDATIRTADQGSGSIATGFLYSYGAAADASIINGGYGTISIGYALAQAGESAKIETGSFSKGGMAIGSVLGASPGYTTSIATGPYSYGAIAGGYCMGSSSVDNGILASGSGSLAWGYCAYDQNIVAGYRGAMAFGAIAPGFPAGTADIRANNINAIQFFSGTNSFEESLKLGGYTGPGFHWLAASQGAPPASTNGMFWFLTASPTIMRFRSADADMQMNRPAVTGAQVGNTAVTLSILAALASMNIIDDQTV